MPLDPATDFVALPHGDHNDLTWWGGPGLEVRLEIDINRYGESTWTPIAVIEDFYWASWNSYVHSDEGGVDVDAPEWYDDPLRYRIRFYRYSTFDYSDYAYTAFVTRWSATGSVTVTATPTGVSGYHIIPDTVTVTATVTANTGIPGYITSGTGTVTADPQSGTVIVDWVVSETVTSTLTFKLRYALGTSTDFRYYMGTDDGVVYTYDPSYLSDNGQTIISTWETIETDLGMPDTFKTVYKASLKYVDKSSALPISVDISNDGGVTWTGAFKTVGTGNKRTKSKDFWYVMSGEFLKFRVQTSSTDKDFQIIGLDIDFLPCGESMET